MISLDTFFVRSSSGATTFSVIISFSDRVAHLSTVKSWSHRGPQHSRVHHIHPFAVLSAVSIQGPKDQVESEQATDTPIGKPEWMNHWIRYGRSHIYQEHRKTGRNSRQSKDHIRSQYRKKKKKTKSTNIKPSSIKRYKTPTYISPCLLIPRLPKN